MVWSTTITEVLNQWAQMGVFSYVIPFLLIFAVVYAIMSKMKIFEGQKGVNAIIALAIGLLALQFDIVSTFFAVIFPRFGVGLAIFLVALILIGFFYPGDDYKKLKWIGFIVGIGVVAWALTNWSWWTGSYSIGGWAEDNFWALAVLALVIGGIVWVVKSGSGSGSPGK